MTSPVVIEHLANGVSRLTITRPPLNLLDEPTLEAISDAFTELEARDETRCIIFTGSGERAFSGGHELTRDEADHGMRTPEEARANPGGTGRKIVEQIEYSAKPVVCAARGWVVGGPISFVLACDIRIASTTVKFRYVDVKMGMAPAWGLTLARMVHFLGRNKTLDFLLDPEDADATRALELGLVTRVVADDQLEAEALRYAEHLALGAPLAIGCIKECTRSQYTEPFPEAQRIQDEWLFKISTSEDSKEGTAAWLDKRAPVFRGV